MNRKKIWLALLLAPMLLAIQAAVAIADPPPPVRGYATHVQLHSDQAVYVSLASNGNANTIRDEAQWAAIEQTEGVFDWTEPDNIVTLAAERGMRVLLLAYTSPMWASGETETNPFWFAAPPLDPADYGVFAGKLAERYGAGGTFWAENPTLTETPLAGIEIWNEPNADGHWGGYPADPEHYTDMLQAAYTSIKAEDPSMPVVVGGLAAVNAYDPETTCQLTLEGVNPVRFLEEMYANGAAGYFDAVGWHPYVFDFTGESTMPELLEYDECSTWSQMAETPVSARSLMIDNGDGAKKIWATELGIPTCTFFAIYPCVSGVEQAELLTTEFDLWTTFDWAGGFIVYDLRDDCLSPLEVQCNFGVVTALLGIQKQAYGELATAWANE